MSELRFDGQVAVVTGAGRGLGQKYAQLLASRGAIVMVNDLGTGVAGGGTSMQPAGETVATIQAAGGEATVNYSDVASEAGATELVRTTIERYGRLDILINNAGIFEYKSFAEINADDLHKMLRVHIEAPFYVTRAAWPQMIEQQFGRVIMTSSSGALGSGNDAHYALAKSAIIGLVRALSIEGRPNKIAVNGIMPGAVTRMTPTDAADPNDGSRTKALIVKRRELLDADLVSPAVGWLAHESCPTSGEMFHVRGGFIGRIFVSQTRGFARRDLSIELIRDQWNNICDSADSTIVPEMAVALEQAFASIEGSQ